MLFRYGISNMELTSRRLAKSTFKSVYTEAEYASVVELFCKMQNSHPFNGDAVRIENIIKEQDVCTVELSKAHFFDFISSNMIKLNFDSWRDKLNEDELTLCKKFIDKFEEDGQPTNLSQILSRNYISNILAVSALIYNTKHEYVLIKRSNKVAVSSNYYGVSVTGSVDGEDFETNNPIFNCATREIKEELGIDIPYENIKLLEIVAGEKKLQPIALCDCLVNIDFDIETMKSSADFHNENAQIVVVKQSELKKYLEKGKYTEAAQEHIGLHI